MLFYAYTQMDLVFQLGRNITCNFDKSQLPTPLFHGKLLLSLYMLPRQLFGQTPRLPLSQLCGRRTQPDTLTLPGSPPSSDELRNVSLSQCSQMKR